MENFFFTFNFMFFSSLFVFSMKHKHLLVTLLSLEFIVLSLYMMLYLYFVFFDSSFVVIIFLTFSVCEAVLGLSIMISLIRTHGNDYFQSFNVLW